MRFCPKPVVFIKKDENEIIGALKYGSGSIHIQKI